MLQEGTTWTTKNVDGWHYGVPAFFWPKIWLLSQNLEKGSKMQMFNVIHEIAGSLWSNRSL